MQAVKRLLSLNPIEKIEQGKRDGFKSKRPEHRKRKNSVFTKAQERIVDSAIASGSVIDAIEAARPDVAVQRQYQIAETIETKAREVMDECGLTDKELIEKHLKPALEARETMFFHTPTKEDPTRIEERIKTAWQPRIRALDVAFQLRGSYPPRTANLQLGVEVSLADEVRKARARVLVRQGEETNENQG